jgi:hypothetical protein
MMPGLEKKFEREMRPDSCVIAGRFPLATWQASRHTHDTRTHDAHAHSTRTHETDARTHLRPPSQLPNTGTR